jgi:hypothetical protein
LVVDVQVDFCEGASLTVAVDCHIDPGEHP